MDEDLYDEFGNYIGPELNSDESEEWMEEDLDDWDDEVIIDEGMDVDEGRQVVLFEDRQYYPDAEEVYPDAEVTVQEEDAMPISEPIIKPVISKRFDHRIKSKKFPPTSFTKKFMTELMENPHFVRNIAIVGNLHHGKTIFCDKLLAETHRKYSSVDKNIKFTDVRYDEHQRLISVKSSGLSLVLESTRGKSFLFHMIDTPGHLNFSDEVTASMRLVDGIVLVVDAVEGLMSQTERLLKHAFLQDLPVVLLLNKMDRLILELKLPVEDAYYKIKHTLDDINSVIFGLLPEDQAEERMFNPAKGNVCFSSGEHGWCFNLRQFSNMYLNKASSGAKVNIDIFASYLWGEKYFDRYSRTFSNESNGESQRSFVEFILEPMYKIYSRIVSEEGKDLDEFLKKLDIVLTKEEKKMNTKPLLKVCMAKFFGIATGFVDMVTEFIPSPLAGAKAKIENSYTGPMDDAIVDHMLKCNPEGPVVVNITKLFPNDDCTRFYAFGRVFSGTVRPGERVKVLGEHYTLEDEEDMSMEVISDVHFYNSRYRITLDSIPAGNLVLLGGIEESIAKTATVVGDSYMGDCYTFKPLRFNTESVCKIAVEPLNPSELPKMLDALRKIDKTYPLCTTKVEESGEHVILGTGELYLDSIMYDLRKTFSEIEIKVSDPVVTFCETVIETSSAKCFAHTPNKQNKLSMLAEPLTSGIAEDLESNVVSIDWPAKNLSKHFREKYGWDVLTSRRIWAFGPDKNGPNVLINTSIHGEVNMGLVNEIKDSVVQGFDWATREGPLCEQPIRNVRFELVEAIVSPEPILHGGNQIIPTARRVAYSAFLTATPRLMEPIFEVEILAPVDTLPAIMHVLSRRRGHIVEDRPRPASPLCTFKAFIPVIDSFGFETDLRAHTQGQAFCMSTFHHWEVAPGDPLDSSVVLRPLEEAPTAYLARDFLIKTRRRKGLSEDVSKHKFFDEELLLSMKNMGIDFMNTGGAI